MNLKSLCLKTLKIVTQHYNEVKDDIHHIDVPRKKFTSKKILFSDKLIAFMYNQL